MIRPPYLSIIASGVGVVAAVVQYTVPAVVPLLERSQSGLMRGDWWRLATPVLVQTLGWHQTAANLVSLAVIGLVSESLLPRLWWLAVLGSGVLGGQAAAYMWEEAGGGSSIAICGLAGGLIVVLLGSVRRQPVPRAAVPIAVGYVVALTGWGLGGVTAAAASGIIFAVAYFALVMVDMKHVKLVALIAAVVCALGLLPLRDLHGASLTSGMAAAVLLVAIRDLAHRSRPRQERPLAPGPSQSASVGP